MHPLTAAALAACDDDTSSGTFLRSPDNLRRQNCSGSAARPACVQRAWVGAVSARTRLLGPQAFEVGRRVCAEQGNCALSSPLIVRRGITKTFSEYWYRLSAQRDLEVCEVRLYPTVPSRPYTLPRADRCLFVGKPALWAKTICRLCVQRVCLARSLTVWVCACLFLAP